jgi:hypothetical protein
MKKLVWAICLLQFILYLGCKTSATAERQAEAAELAIKIETPSFVFIPNSTQPMNGGNINLNYAYSLKISRDTIEAYLPYFGRAYVAPSDPMDGGVKFISTSFDYISVTKGGGSYEIRITPNDVRKLELQGATLYLTANNSGYGSLQITFNNRQPISFYGRIEGK